MDIDMEYQTMLVELVTTMVKLKYLHPLHQKYIGHRIHLPRTTNPPFHLSAYPLTDSYVNKVQRVQNLQLILAMIREKFANVYIHVLKTMGGLIMLVIPIAVFTNAKTAMNGRILVLVLVLVILVNA